MAATKKSVFLSNYSHDNEKAERVVWGSRFFALVLIVVVLFFRTLGASDHRNATETGANLGARRRRNFRSSSAPPPRFPPAFFRSSSAPSNQTVFTSNFPIFCFVPNAAPARRKRRRPGGGRAGSSEERRAPLRRALSGFVEWPRWSAIVLDGRGAAESLILFRVLDGVV